MHLWYSVVLCIRLISTIAQAKPVWENINTGTTPTVLVHVQFNVVYLGRHTRDYAQFLRLTLFSEMSIKCLTHC